MEALEARPLTSRSRTRRLAGPPSTFRPQRPVKHGSGHLSAAHPPPCTSQGPVQSQGPLPVATTGSGESVVLPLGEVHDPQPMGRRGGEVPVDEVLRPGCALVRDRRADRLVPANPLDTGGSHQSLDDAPGRNDALTAQLRVDLCEPRRARRGQQRGPGRSRPATAHRIATGHWPAGPCWPGRSGPRSCSHDRSGPDRSARPRNARDARR